MLRLRDVPLNSVVVALEWYVFKAVVQWVDNHRWLHRRAPNLHLLDCVQ